MSAKSIILLLLVAFCSVALADINRRWMPKNDRFDWQDYSKPKPHHWKPKPSPTWITSVSNIPSPSFSHSYSYTPSASFSDLPWKHYPGRNAGPTPVAELVAEN